MRRESDKRSKEGEKKALGNFPFIGTLRKSGLVIKNSSKWKGGREERKEKGCRSPDVLLPALNMAGGKFWTPRAAKAGKDEGWLVFKGGQPIKTGKNRIRGRPRMRGGEQDISALSACPLTVRIGGKRVHQKKKKKEGLTGRAPIRQCLGKSKKLILLKRKKSLTKAEAHKITAPPSYFSGSNAMEPKRGEKRETTKKKRKERDVD